jgi:hypothetical protein
MAGKADENRGVSPAVMAVAVAVLLLFVGWLAYANLFAPPKAPPPTPEAQQRLDKYDDWAKKTHGDINKLSPEERDTLMKETGGYGAGILQKIAKDKGY